VDQDLLKLATAREGHFRLESGHHGGLWLDLDGLFADPVRIAPFVDTLAEALRAFAPAAVCGPLVGGAFLAQMLAQRLGAAFLFTERMPPDEGQGLYSVKYRVPRGLQARIRGEPIAIVDDAISAGSAVRATYAEVCSFGAQPVVAGALLRLGSAALPFFEDRRVPVTSVAQLPYELWTPAECPLCASGQPLEDAVTAADHGRP
jgi:orotate phosphoribosyltransferase